jgi:sugar lactone lactonase YvrE
MMVDSKGRLKLADFGIAAVVSDSMSKVSVQNATSGTPPYMSPQQLAGKRPQVTDDIYALGATLYELLTGKPPFCTGDIVHQVMNQAPEPMEERLVALGIENEIPPAVGAMVMACLAKEPGQRPQSARAVAEWIGLESEVRHSAESVAAALFPPGPPIPAPLAAPQPAGNVQSKPAVWRRNLAAVGIVVLVMAASFWLLKGTHTGNHSNVPAPPAWISTEVPKPGTDGWIVLFDGKRLYGCSPPAADIAAGKVSIQDGCLRLDSDKIMFNLTGRDVVIRARVKKLSGQSCNLGVRIDTKGQPRDCAGCLLAGNDFLIGHHVDGPWNEIVRVHAQRNYDGFFEMEFRAAGSNLDLMADGQDICQAEDNFVVDGTCNVSTIKGITLFQSIEVRILDKAAPIEPAWISSEVPKPGADGWIVLFDGKRLYGCSPPAADIASGKLSIQDGCLRMDSTTLDFNLIGRDVAIRARLKKASGVICDLMARNDGQNNGKGRDCEGGGGDPNSFGVGHHVDQPWRDLVSIRTQENYLGFFELEFRAEGENLTLKLDDRDICHARENSIMESGKIGVKSLNGITLFQTIEAKILDKPPATMNEEWTFTTIAGKAGSPGATDGAGTNASFDHPNGIAVDKEGNLWVSDWNNMTIRLIRPSGDVSTIAGLAGTGGSNDGVASKSRFNKPLRLAVDLSNNAYVSDDVNNTIRKITSTGMVSTFAGQAGSIGSTDGSAVIARFIHPDGLAITSDGNILLVDEGNNTIRKMTPDGMVSTIAGQADGKGSMDGAGPTARFNRPTGIAVGARGFVYVTDAGNNTIRVINPSGVVSTLAGKAGIAGTADGMTTNARFNFPVGIALDGEGNLYVTDKLNHTIRKITSTGVVTTIGGLAGNAGSSDGVGANARFQLPESPALDSQGNIYVTDSGNHTIRKGVRHTVPAPARTIVGTWKWPERDHIVTIKANGICTDSWSSSGTWTLIDATNRVYRIQWKGTPNFIDTLTLSTDGNSLTGHNQYNTGNATDIRIN